MRTGRPVSRNHDVFAGIDPRRIIPIAICEQYPAVFPVARGRAVPAVRTAAQYDLGEPCLCGVPAGMDCMDESIDLVTQSCIEGKMPENRRPHAEQQCDDCKGVE